MRTDLPCRPGLEDAPSSPHAACPGPWCKAVITCFRCSPPGQLETSPWGDGELLGAWLRGAEASRGVRSPHSAAEAALGAWAEVGRRGAVFREGGLATGWHSGEGAGEVMGHLGASWKPRAFSASALLGHLWLPPLTFPVCLLGSSSCSVPSRLPREHVKNRFRGSIPRAGSGPGNLHFQLASQATLVQGRTTFGKADLAGNQVLSDLEFLSSSFLPFWSAPSFCFPWCCPPSPLPSLTVSEPRSHRNHRATPGGPSRSPGSRVSCLCPPLALEARLSLLLRNLPWPPC